MASVLFSTIGQAVGGPLGGAVGALVGGTIDRAMFGPRRTEPPRDIFVQRSAYGEPLPRVYGRVRTAGLLIWAAPVRPLRSGGKGGSGRRGHAASFAIALSSGPIVRVGRIWADGREFRAADGTFDGRVEMRVHHGSLAQAPDPLIVAAEGAGRAPAYRGLAYVVFEDLSLAPFGNRIPNLSFEVIADEADGPGAWLRDLARDAACEVGEVAEGAALGFLAEDASSRQSLEFLATWLDAPISWPNGRLRLGGPPREAVIPARDLAAVSAEHGPFRPPERAISLDRRPAMWSAGHLDPDRDYQRGLQTEWRPRPGREIAAAGPVVATASAARLAAARMLRRAEASAETLEMSLPFRWLWLAVGDVVRIEGMPGRWRVVRKRAEGAVVRLLCEALPPQGVVLPRPADPGRALPSPVMAAPPTAIRAIEPAVDPWEAMAPAALAVVATGGAGWSGASISCARAGDPDLRPLGTVAEGRWAGRLAAPLGPGPLHLWDERNAILVDLEPGDDAPESRPMLSVLAGANMVLVGEELLQFRDAEHLGAGRFRLRGLLRARGGGDMPAVPHPAGTPVLRVDPLLLLKRPVAADEAGLSLLLYAEGRGDPPGGTELAVYLSAAGHAPLAPCHARATRLPNGDLRFSWVPRRRESFSWSGPDAPTGVGPFQWELEAPAAARTIVEGTAMLWTLAEQVALAGAPVREGRFRVVALGPGPLRVRAGAPVSFST